MNEIHSPWNDGANYEPEPLPAMFKTWGEAARVATIWLTVSLMLGGVVYLGVKVL